VTAPLVAWHPDGAGADITFPYSAYVVAELKRAVPAPLRTYDPDTKTWTVDGRYVHLVYHVLAQVFGDVDVEGSRYGAADRGDPPREAALVILHLRPTAPPELVDAAYRCLARLHHPDAGGDHDAMLRLNQALEVLR